MRRLCVRTANEKVLHYAVSTRLASSMKMRGCLSNQGSSPAFFNRLDKDDVHWCYSDANHGSFPPHNYSCADSFNCSIFLCFNAINIDPTPSETPSNRNRPIRPIK